MLTIDVTRAKLTGQIGISFQDNGPGITKENLDIVFEPFFTTREGGTGLGLAICFEIIQRHGGQIAVESNPGQGAKFTVWLPLSEVR